MLTKRGFSGFAACAICGMGEFVAAEASAQGTQPAATPGVTRKILSQMDGPAPGYVTLLVEATIDAGVTVGRHTHPGINLHMFWKAASNFPYKVNQPAQSNQAMASKYRPKHRTRVVSLAIPRLEFLSLMLWRRGSPWRLQLNTALNCGQTSSWRRGELLQFARCEWPRSLGTSLCRSRTIHTLMRTSRCRSVLIRRSRNR